MRPLLDSVPIEAEPGLLLVPLLLMPMALLLRIVPVAALVRRVMVPELEMPTLPVMRPLFDSVPIEPELLMP